MSGLFSRQKRLAEAQRVTAAMELERSRARADYVNSLTERGLEELRRLQVLKSSRPA